MEGLVDGDKLRHLSSPSSRTRVANCVDENIIIKVDTKFELSNRCNACTVILSEIQSSLSTCLTQDSADRDHSNLLRLQRFGKQIFYTDLQAFLNKFGNVLNENHLNHLVAAHVHSLEVKSHLDRLLKLMKKKNINVAARNRRYEAMKRMEIDGNYFSEEEMEKREPLLYHKMVGQYLTETEKLEKLRKTSCKSNSLLANFFLKIFEEEELSELLKAQEKVEKEDKVTEATLNFSDVSDQSKTHSCLKKKWGFDWEDEEELSELTSTQSITLPQNLRKKDYYFKKFKALMQQKFLYGEDSDINYADIDSNPDYDCLDLMAQDAEDKYFEEETSYFTGSCTDTGIEDY